MLSGLRRIAANVARRQTFRNGMTVTGRRILPASYTAGRS